MQSCSFRYGSRATTQLTEVLVDQRLSREKEPSMLLIGVDYHPSQQIAFLNQDTGECGELRVNHGDGEAERFYRGLQQRRIRVRVGMEATKIEFVFSCFWLTAEPRSS